MLNESHRSIIYLIFVLFFVFAYATNPPASNALRMLLYPHFTPHASVSLVLAGGFGPALTLCLLLNSIFYGAKGLKKQATISLRIVYVLMIISGVIASCLAIYRFLQL